VIIHADARPVSADHRAGVVTPGAYNEDLTGREMASFNSPWAKPPVEFRDDPVLKSLFLCLDEKCLGGKNPRALKPFAFECPTTFVHCRQDVAQKLADSGIKKQAIQQQCGNVNLFPEQDENQPARPTASLPWIIFIILGIAALAAGILILIFQRRQ
jgi:hypothetical protein